MIKIWGILSADFRLETLWWGREDKMNTWPGVGWEWEQECGIPVPSLSRVGCAVLVKAHPAPQVSNVPIGERRDPAPASQREGGKSRVRGRPRAPRSSRGPALRRWVRAAEGAPLQGAGGEAPRAPAPPAGGEAPRSARVRSWPGTGSRLLPRPSHAGRRIMSLRRKEMSHLPRASGRPGASEEATGTRDNGGK